MPTVSIELCGRLADLAGPRIALDLPAGGCDAAALLRQAARQFPALAPMIAAGRVKVCVDERLVDPTTPIPLHGAIALLPPVSGG